MEFMTTKEDRNLFAFAKMGLLYIVLMAINILSVRLLLDVKLFQRADLELSILEILNVFTVLEICKMIIHLTVSIVKYLVNLFSLITKCEIENKDTIFKVMALITSVITLGLEGLILALVVMRTKFLPFFVIGGILNSVFEIITNIKLLYVAIIKLQKLNGIMDITKAEIEEEDLDLICVICQHEIDVGKMLECKHVFHLKCLKKWILNEGSCPSCKREDVIFVPENKLSPLKHKIMTKRRLLEAGIQRDTFIDELEGVKANDDDTYKSRYRQIEKYYLRKHKHDKKRKARKEEYPYSDSDSADTDQMIREVQEVERKITFMMSEITKAREIVEKYDRKLTRRLERKRRRRLQENKKRDEEQQKARSEAAQDTEERKSPFKTPSGRLTSQSHPRKPVGDYYDLPPESMDEDKSGDASNKNAKPSTEYGENHTDNMSDITPLAMSNRQPSKPIRLRDYDLAPKINRYPPQDERQNSNSNFTPVKLKFEQNEDKNKEEVQINEEDELEENTHRSAPDVESNKNIQKLDIGKSKFVEDEDINSENEEEIKLITQPEFTQFMDLSKEKGKLSSGV